MKINNHPISRAARIYQQQRTRENAETEKTGKLGKDKVTLSSEGREMQSLMHKVQNTPDVRPQAEALKAAVKSGTYKVSGEKIAASILKSLE